MPNTKGPKMAAFFVNKTITKALTDQIRSDSAL